MLASEYRTLFELETSYWWFRGLRSMLVRTLKELGVGPSARLLDAGCGTGKTVATLREQVTPLSVGFDLAEDATPYWRARELTGVSRASINAIPFRQDSFDAVVCVNVLECEQVEERQAYRELWRVAKPGGLIVLVVAAYPWLMNASHHQAVGACRRYTKATLRSLLQQTPGQVLRLTHLFPTTFPLIAGSRLLQRMTNPQPEAFRSDIRPLPRVINESLTRMTVLESRLLSKTDFPFGSSLMAVVRKALGQNGS